MRSTSVRSTAKAGMTTEPPSRALDAEIACAAHPGSEWRLHAPLARIKWLHNASGCVIFYGEAPLYTTTLYAANTLAVPGWFMDVHQSITEPQEWVVMLGRFPADGEVMGAAPTLAQAIAAAWLRARATTAPTHATQTGGGENG